MTKGSVRLLTLDDVDAFREVRLRALKEEPTAFMDTYEEMVEQPLENFARYFESGWIAGAFLDGRLVGTAGLYCNAGRKVMHKGTLWCVYVAPEARGKGYARRCIELVLHEAKQTGLELVHLSTTADNPVTVSLYKSLGFAAWGIEKHDLKMSDGSYVDNVVMTKWLT